MAPEEPLFLLAAHLDLTVLPPTPQRLRELIESFARWGYGALYIEWGELFPWSLDERFRGTGFYSEELVAGLQREAAARGLELASVFPSPRSLGFVARIAAYRHLFSWQGGRSVLDLDSQAGRRFFEELVDDYLLLLPESQGVLLDLRSEVDSESQLGFMAKAFGERGVGVVAPAVGGRAWPGPPEASLLAGAESLAASPDTALDAGVLLARTRVAGERERALRLLGREKRRDEGRGRLPRLLLSFQEPPPGRGRRPALFDSVELALGVAQSLAEGGGDGEAAGRPPVAAEELEARIEESWGYIRGIRELLVEEAVAVQPSPPRAGELQALRGRLEAVRMQAGRLASLLAERFAERVDPPSLAGAIEALLLPLREESLLLEPRIALAAKRAGVPSAGETA